MKLQFIGFFILSMCCRLLDVETSPIYVRRDVVFNDQDLGPGTERYLTKDLMKHWRYNQALMTY